MKFKKFLSVIISLSVAVSALTFNASAHTSDYFNGTYLSTSPCNQKSLGFVVYSSAQSSLLNYNDVYSKAFAWDGITDNVNIRIAMYTPGMPTNNFFAVVGEDLGSSYYGKINAYNSSGAEISMDSNWYSVKITMNNNGIFNCVLNPKQAAAKTFIHEVGHTLKLSHPIQQGGLDGHQYSGKPVAIMNQGAPNGSYVPTTVATHDRQNLTAKWGA